MKQEVKELVCECGCNIFGIRKVRDINSTFKRKGHREYYCVDCESDEIKTEWVVVNWRIREVISTRWDRMKERIERLRKNNKRQSEWIDSALEGTL
jgi:hypothetical protein